MDKFFAVFGKLVLILLFVGALAGAGYYFGRSGKINIGSAPQPDAATTSNPGAATPASDTTQMESDKESQGAKTANYVKAGLGPDSGLGFTPYQITVPGDWTSNRVTTNEGTWVDNLTITKGEYQLKIWQAATGGAICLFPGDTPMEGPSSTYTIFIDIAGEQGANFRRSTSAGGSPTEKKGYTVCMKSQAYGNYQLPTSFGHVSYTTPLAPDEEILKEMDGMVASLKKL